MKKKYTGDPAFKAEIEKIAEEQKRKEAERRKVIWIDRKKAAT